MNLFDAPQPNLFDEGFENVDITDVRSDESIRREARLAAVTTMNPGDGLVGQLQELTQQYHEQIKVQGDHSIRHEAAARQQTRELEGLGALMNQTTGFDVDGTLLQGAAAASRQALVEDVEKRKSYALEQEALTHIQNLAAAGDYTQAKILMNNLEGDPEDRILEINTKRLILQREMEKAGIAKESQPWALDALDFIVGIVPIQTNLSKQNLVDIDKGLKDWYDGLFAGTRLRSEVASLYNLPLSEFSDAVQNQLIPNLKENSTFMGYHSKSEELELLASFARQTPTALETNTWAALDNIGLVSAGTLKSAVSLPGMLMRMGARKEAQTLMAQAAMQMTTEGVESAAIKTGVEAAEVVAGLSPSAINVGASASVVSAATETNNILEKGRQMLAALQSATATARLTDDELAVAQAAIVKSSTDRPIKDVSFMTVSMADGSQVNKALITIGKSTGDGYASERSARGYAKSLGYADAKIIRDESGQFFVQLEKNVTEQGFATNVLNVKATNFLSRRILNSNMLSDELLANMAQVAGNKKGKIIDSMAENLQAPFRKLKPEHRETLSQILATGENQGKWFSESELNVLTQRAYKRDITPNEIEAYHTAKIINDMEFTLRNDDAYKNLHIKGYETVEFDTGMRRIDRVNGIVVRDIQSAEMGRVYDITYKRHWTTKPTAEDLKRMQDEGFMLVNLQNPVELADGTKIKQFLTRGNDIKINPLDKTQLAYRAGGHRMYKGKYFVKQTVKGVQPDTGKEFLASPNTYIVAETPAEASFWANKMEQARLAWKSRASASEIDEIFEGHAGFDDGKTFIEKMEKGSYDPDHSFVVKYDREMPDEYFEKNMDIENFADVDEAAYDGWLRTNGRMYYSRKGEALKDWQGSQAPTLDPFITIDKALTNIANITSMSDYKISAMERWINTYAKYLDLKDLNPDKLSHFLDSTVNRGVNSRIVQAAETQREIIKRNLGWKSELDLQAQQYQRNIIDWISGTDPLSPQNKTLKVVNDWWQEKDPIVGLRSMAFDMKMGFFNVAQLPMQIQTAFAATMLSPTNGMRGFATYPSMRYFLTQAGTENALDTFVKRGVHTLSGFDDPNDFKAMMRSAKQSGFFNVAPNHNLVSRFGPGSVVGSQVLASDGALRTTGRFFFNEGEIANRSVAWRIAWDEAQLKMPGVDHMSPAFQREVAGRAEKYSFSMSQQSAAWWQKGALSVPTQFWAYSVRMMEAMLGGEFTRAQRARLIVGQTLLYGSAGLPAMSYVTDKIKEHHAPNMDVSRSTLESFWGMADRGLFDTALYYGTGGEIDALVGKRYGTGDFLANTIKDLMGASSYGDKSFIDIMTGATAGIMGTTAKGLIDVARYASAESGADIEGMPMTRDALLKTAVNVSTIGNALKAYMVFEYGTQLSNKGATAVAGLPPIQAFATALSLQPGQQDQISTMMSYRTKRKEAITEASKVVQNYRTRWVNEPDNRRELEEQINIFIKLLPPDIRKDVQRQTQRSTDKSLYESMARKIEQEKVANTLIKEVEDGVTN